MSLIRKTRPAVLAAAVSRPVIGAVVALTIIGAVVAPGGSASADAPTCQQHTGSGSCDISIIGPGAPGVPSHVATMVCTTEKARVVPCYDATFGLFTTIDGIAVYVTLMDPQPPKTGATAALWDGHTDGAVYEFVIIEGCAGCARDGTVWLKNPPASAFDPAVLALLAGTVHGKLRLPQPAFHRSPSERNDYRGQAFTYVGLPTWFWTDAAQYKTLTKSASLGGVSVTVTATPQSLRFDPGDGSGIQTCRGPGVPWDSSFGNSAAPGNCSFAYRHVSSAGPVTSTLTVNWAISWTSNTGANGTLGALFSRSTATLNVLQVQVVAHN